jgi:hypothetical protein
MTIKFIQFSGLVLISWLVPCFQAKAMGPRNPSSISSPLPLTISRNRHSEAVTKPMADSNQFLTPGASSSYKSFVSVSGANSLDSTPVSSSSLLESDPSVQENIDQDPWENIYSVSNHNNLPLYAAETTEVNQFHLLEPVYYYPEAEAPAVGDDVANCFYPLEQAPPAHFFSLDNSCPYQYTPISSPMLFPPGQETDLYNGSVYLAEPVGRLSASIPPQQADLNDPPVKMEDFEAMLTDDSFEQDSEAMLTDDSFEQDSEAMLTDDSFEKDSEESLTDDSLEKDTEISQEQDQNPGQPASRSASDSALVEKQGIIRPIAKPAFLPASSYRALRSSSFSGTSRSGYRPSRFAPPSFPPRMFGGSHQAVPLNDAALGQAEDFCQYRSLNYSSNEMQALIDIYNELKKNLNVNFPRANTRVTHYNLAWCIHQKNYTWITGSKLRSTIIYEPKKAFENVKLSGVLVNESLLKELGIELQEGVDIDQNIFKILKAQKPKRTRRSRSDSEEESDAMASDSNVDLAENGPAKPIMFEDDGVTVKEYSTAPVLLNAVQGKRKIFLWKIKRVLQSQRILWFPKSFSIPEERRADYFTISHYLSARGEGLNSLEEYADKDHHQYLFGLEAEKEFGPRPLASHNFHTRVYPFLVEEIQEARRIFPDPESAELPEEERMTGHNIDTFFPNQKSLKGKVQRSPGLMALFAELLGMTPSLFSMAMDCLDKFPGLYHVDTLTRLVLEAFQNVGAMETVKAVPLSDSSIAIESQQLDISNKIVYAHKVYEFQLKKLYGNWQHLFAENDQLAEQYKEKISFCEKKAASLISHLILAGSALDCIDQERLTLIDPALFELVIKSTRESVGESVRVETADPEKKLDPASVLTFRHLKHRLFYLSLAAECIWQKAYQFEDEFLEIYEEMRQEYELLVITENVKLSPTEGIIRSLNKKEEYKNAIKETHKNYFADLWLTSPEIGYYI